VEASRSAAVSYHSIDSYLEYNSGSIEGISSDDSNSSGGNSSGSSSSRSSKYERLINTCNQNNINANYDGDLEKKVFDLYVSLK
jgi:hypothetical protein